MPDSEVGYLTLYRSGELERRTRRLEARLSDCNICPQRCGVNRLHDEDGFCRTGRLPVVATVCAHHGEEPVLSGSRGSGTIFFGHCNLRCVYCQNHQISQDFTLRHTREVEPHQLAELMLDLQDNLGCHNINLVSPSHFVPQIVRAVLEAVPLGLKLPLVYNSSGYDSLETLRELEGIISIYLPDLRYADDRWALKFSRGRHYVTHARTAIKEMYRQVGNLTLDESGLARKGLIVRHLILPNRLAGSVDSLRWLARELSPTVAISIMAQYYPTNLAPQIPRLSRTITPAEYTEVTGLLDKLRMDNGWLQELGSPAHYRPDFGRQGHPFEVKR